MTQKTIEINREAFEDLLKVKDEFDNIIESLQLMKDKEFMNSYKKAKEEIRKRDFVDLNEL